jgi:hypothetical protein
MSKKLSSADLHYKLLVKASEFLNVSPTTIYEWLNEKPKDEPKTRATNNSSGLSGNAEKENCN